MINKKVTIAITLAIVMAVVILSGIFLPKSHVHQPNLSYKIQLQELNRTIKKVNDEISKIEEKSFLKKDLEKILKKADSISKFTEKIDNLSPEEDRIVSDMLAMYKGDLERGLENLKANPVKKEDKKEVSEDFKKNSETIERIKQNQLETDRLKALGKESKIKVKEKPSVEVERINSEPIKITENIIVCDNCLGDKAIHKDEGFLLKIPKAKITTAKLYSVEGELKLKFVVTRVLDKVPDRIQKNEVVIESDEGFYRAILVSL